MASDRRGPDLGIIPGRDGHRAAGEVPWSEETEEAVLCAPLMDPTVTAAVVRQADEECFHREANRRVFRAMCRIQERGEILDVVTLTNELRSAGELEGVGGPAYLARLVDAVPSAANVEQHLRILREKATLRELQALGSELLSGTVEAGAGETDELLRRAEERLKEVRERAAASETETFDMAEVLSDPANLELPNPLLHGTAVPGNLVLWSGDPKTGGKTSLLTAGAGAVATGGLFLGRSVPQGTVLWVMGEGSERHLARYLAQAGLSPQPETFIAIRAEGDPVGELERAVEIHEPDLVVIDSLGSWISPLDIDLHKPEIAEPLRRVERVARSGPAVVLIHHGRKADGDPAGHHQIKAIPDAIRVVEQGETDRERVVKGMGRWHLPTIRYRMEIIGPHPDVPDLDRVLFEELDPDREIEERLMDFIEANPGANKREIREGVGGRAMEVDKALKTLEEEGIVDVDRSGSSHSHRITENPRGHATDTVGHDPGHGSTGNGGGTVSRGGLSPCRGSPTDTPTEPVDQHTTNRDED